MTGVENLTLEDLLGLVHGLGIGPARDLGLREAAIARPQSGAFREDAHPTIKLKAADLLDSREPRVGDGNKRLGWRATTVFLDVNGEPVGLDDDIAFQLVLDVAEGRIGAEEIADRLGVSRDRASASEFPDSVGRAAHQTTSSHNVSRRSPHSGSTRALVGAVCPGQRALTAFFAMRGSRVQIPSAPRTHVHQALAQQTLSSATITRMGSPPSTWSHLRAGSTP